MVFGPIVAVIAIIAIIRIFVRNYIKVPPNEVAVFTGRGKPKVVHGGARFRIPGIERVDYMSLEPFKVAISLNGALSKDGVPVNIEAVGLIRIGASTEAIQTAVQRFLTTDRNVLGAQINDILNGSLRGVVATMTVEDLNGNRDRLVKSVTDDASPDTQRIGFEIDALKILTIADENGYLEALGKKRTAEVKRDAAIGTAEADRDARTRSAQANQSASVAEAEADTAIAAANKARDVTIAQLRAATDAERARADQAGPQAKAEATMAVLVAEQAAKAAEEEARIEVERQRAKATEAALKADVVAGAEADKLAAIARADGESQATILRAEANAEATRKVGCGEADARKAQAEATQAELEAKANGERAQLLAEAAGKLKVAEALGAFTPEASRLLMYQDILVALVDAIRASAEQVGAIKNVSIIGGSDTAKGGLESLLGLTPQNLAGVIEALRAQGFDLPSILTSTVPRPAADSEATN
jgi:flotillin